MKFRKKPVIIEAFQFDGDFMNSDGNYYVPDWAVNALKSNNKAVMFGATGYNLAPFSPCTS